MGLTIEYAGSLSFESSLVVLKVKKLSEFAILPQYQREGDAGLDLYAIASQTIWPGESALVPTGIAIELPPNTEAQIRPRSGLALKQGITVLNTPGTIDAGYRGEIGVILINHGKVPFTITPGLRIAQMVITAFLQAKVELVNHLSSTTRNIGGFGSTGTN